MLDREDGQQGRVDRECAPKRLGGGAVESRGDGETADEPDRVEKHPEEDQVAQAAVCEDQDPFVISRLL